MYLPQNFQSNFGSSPNSLRQGGSQGGSSPNALRQGGSQGGSQRLMGGVMNELQTLYGQQFNGGSGFKGRNPYPQQSQYGYPSPYPAPPQYPYPSPPYGGGNLGAIRGGGIGQVTPTNIPFRDPGYGSPVRTQNLISAMSGPQDLMSD